MLTTIKTTSESAATILVNVSDDKAVLDLLANDDSFIELLFSLITNPAYPGADCIAMLLANMAKHESIPGKILKLKREKPKEEWKVSDSENAMDQLMDLFVKGSGKTLNKNANFDYLAYLFADIAGVWLSSSRSPLDSFYLGHIANNL